MWVFLEILEKCTNWANSTLTSHDSLEGSNFHQMVSNLKGNGMVILKNPKLAYGHFVSDFIPLQLCLGIMTKREK